MLLISCNSDKTKGPSFPEHQWHISAIEKADSVNPILVPDSSLIWRDKITGKPIRWMSRNVLNPASVVHNDTLFLLFRAQDSSGTSRIGLAYSVDGIHFSVHKSPVFYPDKDSMQVYEWNQKKFSIPQNTNCQFCLFDGVEDPRIVKRDDGLFVMTYTAYDGKTARLSLATSRNLYEWEKKGLVLREPKYKNYWSKSGAIVCEFSDNRIKATKVAGKYWMYFGDTKIFMAYSDDLIHWTPSENEENGALVEVLWPRPGYFDSRLVEPGPFALNTSQGIFLLYNASNAKNANDSTLPYYTYAAGQALFYSDAPYKLKRRKDEYFIKPEKPYELKGEVNNVCFVEGMSFFRNQWFIYYGTADSRVAMARIIW
ncbi:MAG: glycoside hydrolase family 130 protein [Chitinophagaceae bacterium]|nr:glycoside hydrolase family 130 protein [Chitinophagaceae bacterium]